MVRMPPSAEPVVSPEFDRLVHELDERLDEDFLAELRPALDRLPEVEEPAPESEG